MFRDMRNSPNIGTVDERTAAGVVQDRLPPGWSVEIRSGPAGPELVLKALDGRESRLGVIVRKRVQPRDVPHLLAQVGAEDMSRLLLAPFLSPRARELLTEGGMSFVDGTGNLRVVVSSPAIFLEGNGADRDPDRQSRALRSLKGAAAGRVVRALCDFLPPYGIRTLA